MEFYMNGLESLLENQIRKHNQQQFELKLCYSPISQSKKNKYRIQLYFFIPDALMINNNTYPKSRFYQNLMSRIRFKTPDISLEKILDSENRDSPLPRIDHLLKARLGEIDEKEIVGELKLLGNIIQSQVRNHVRFQIDLLNKEKKFIPLLSKQGIFYVERFFMLTNSLESLEKRLIKRKVSKKTILTYRYVDDFISHTGFYYFSGLLYSISGAQKKGLDSYSRILKKYVDQERSRRKRKKYSFVELKDSDQAKEQYLYRIHILRNFISDALALSTKRKDVKEQYFHVVAILSAALAMFLYLLLFIWQGRNFVVNSIPFILISVLLYVIKDRVKEWIRLFYSKSAFLWFPDYRIKIRSWDEQKKLGKVLESVFFIKEEKLPSDIADLRKKGFISPIEKQARPETIMKYEKEVILNTKKLYAHGARRHSLNDILRFNPVYFIRRVEDAYKEFYFLNPKTREVEKGLCPRVYHLNLVMKTFFTTKRGKIKEALVRMRVILDKNGIKRVETLN